MEHLGFTRSCNQLDHLLQTPDTFVRAALPGMRNATAIVHVSPARGAAFTAYTVEFAANGRFTPGPSQSFLYVLEGSILSGDKTLGANQFAYYPPDAEVTLVSKKQARAMIFEKPLVGEPGPRFSRRETAIELLPLGAKDSGLGVRVLVPEGPTYDFAVNTMVYQPGVTLPMVEIHFMEHGLLMLEGEGIYRLGEKWYPVKAGDFIWMAPYCPQWFGALGRKPAKYLIYKDWNRHPMDTP
jgi:(S)-ureidoglycine aminohydrolase